MDLERFLEPRERETIGRVGLHKIAGVMNGIDEMNFKTAVAVLAAKAYIKRAEMRTIQDGIRALASLRGEKVAQSPWGPLLTRALPGAALGGVGAYLASPQDPEQELRNTAVGAGVGGGLGLLNALRRGFAADPAVASALHTALSGLR